jgi:putative chitobiose transport system permease protein
MKPPQATGRGAARLRRTAEKIFWYVVLCLVASLTILPFVWVVSTSLKGPEDLVYSVPPQFIPRDLTFANFVRVWRMLPVASFFSNSLVVTVTTVVLHLLFTALAAYPFAKMRFRGRDAIFYVLLATAIVPVQLVYIPSYVLAVNVFKYYDHIASLIFPNLVSVFNIFLMRQAFKSVPDDLLDAGRIDGASELRLWWDILMPVARPTLATVAINQFVFMWNDFFWPSLMLHTRERMTLQVGLVAMQGAFTSDTRGVAAGVVMTVVPILILFVVLQRQFVRGLTGAVKG